MTQPRKSGAKLTTGQRIAGMFGYVLQITLLAAALSRSRHRPADGINGDRRLWTAVSFINFVGPIRTSCLGASAAAEWMRRRSSSSLRRTFYRVASSHSQRVGPQTSAAEELFSSEESRPI